MITASPEVITAGATSALLVARSARRLHTSGGGYGLLATIIHSYVSDGMRGRVFSGSSLIWQSMRLASLLLGGLLAGTAGIRAACYLGGTLQAAAARAGLILRRPGSCGGHDLVPPVPFGAVFAPAEPHQEGVKDGQQSQADREVDGGDPVELVGDEGQQQQDQPG